MNKIANVVYSGWMVKSPPEKKFKLSGPWKIFRAKWKRRYFVLFKPASSLPHQYVLNYYSDESCKKLKGYIDLEHCEQIIESLDLDNFPFLLAIKTYHRSKERTYFLATDTEDQMTTWVRNLCSVCGLKPEDNAADLPPDRQDVTKQEVKPAATNGVIKHQNHTKVVSPVVAQPQPQAQPNPVSHSHGPVAERHGSQYIPLTDCYTPKVSAFDRQGSIDSMPDEPAPPPPVKRGHDLDDGPNDVFHASTYDTPKAFENVDSLYKVPPPRIVKDESEDNVQDAYDIPPHRHSPSTPRSSSSESQKADSAYSSQSGLTYDYPPPKCEPNTVLTADDVYDIPPSHPQTVTPPSRPSDIPPARPPKPISLQEPYQNIPPNSKMFDSRNSVDINRVVPPSSVDIGGSYDLPRSSSIGGTYDLPKPASTKEASLFDTPPPPQSCGQTQHAYINAGTSYVKSNEDDVYLAMDRAYPPSDSHNQRIISDAYTDMSGKSEDNYADMAGVKTSVYDHPPPARPPRISPRAAPIPDHNSDIYNVYSSSRTRSFKRNCSSSTTNSSPPRDGFRVELPSRNVHPDCSTSSEDEDEQIWVDPAKVFPGIMSQYNTQASNIWGSTPPAPRSQERELKYLDLALETSSDKEPVRSPHSLQTGHSSPTEYREIDFVKTQALSDVKQFVDKQRKSEDH